MFLRLVVKDIVSFDEPKMEHVNCRHLRRCLQVCKVPIGRVCQWSKPEEIVTKLRQVEALTGQGMARLDAIQQIGVSEQTFYRWKKKYGGMGTDQLTELRRLQKENERLRKAVSDLTLDKLILAEAAKGNF